MDCVPPSSGGSCWAGEYFDGCEDAADELVPGFAGDPWWDGSGEERREGGWRLEYCGELLGRAEDGACWVENELWL